MQVLRRVGVEGPTTYQRSSTTRFMATFGPSTASAGDCACSDGLRRDRCLGRVGSAGPVEHGPAGQRGFAFARRAGRRRLCARARPGAGGGLASTPALGRCAAALALSTCAHSLARALLPARQGGSLLPGAGGCRRAFGLHPGPGLLDRDAQQPREFLGALGALPGLQPSPHSMPAPAPCPVQTRPCGARCTDPSLAWPPPLRASASSWRAGARKPPRAGAAHRPAWSRVPTRYGSWRQRATGRVTAARGQQARGSATRPP
jgi:hypothetical protein